MKRIALLLAGLVLGLMLAMQATAADYDLVILSGRFGLVRADGVVSDQWQPD